MSRKYLYEIHASLPGSDGEVLVAGRDEPQWGPGCAHLWISQNKSSLWGFDNVHLHLRDRENDELSLYHSQDYSQEMLEQMWQVNDGSWVPHHVKQNS